MQFLPPSLARQVSRPFLIVASFVPDGVHGNNGFGARSGSIRYRKRPGMYITFGRIAGLRGSAGRVLPVVQPSGNISVRTSEAETTTAPLRAVNRDMIAIAEKTDQGLRRSGYQDISGKLRPCAPNSGKCHPTLLRPALLHHVGSVLPSALRVRGDDKGRCAAAQETFAYRVRSDGGRRGGESTDPSDSVHMLIHSGAPEVVALMCNCPLAATLWRARGGTVVGGGAITVQPSAEEEGGRTLGGGIAVHPRARLLQRK